MQRTGVKHPVFSVEELITRGHGDASGAEWGDSRSVYTSRKDGTFEKIAGFSLWDDVEWNIIALLFYHQERSHVV